MNAAAVERGLPDVLYHYTDIGGFEGIYKSGELWGTHVAYMNDTVELHIGLDAVLQVLNQEKSSLIAEGETRHTTQLLADTERMLHIVKAARTVECYVISLSKEPDQLSQWRGYAPTGYSVGFSTEALFQSCGPSQRLGEVQYFPDQNKTQLPAAIINLLRESLADMKATADISDEGVESWLSSFIAEKAAFMKDVNFKEEREVRIVQAAPSRTFFTPSKYGMTPRMKLPLVDGAINKVIVGPGAHSDLRLHSLRGYVRRVRFKQSEHNELSAPPESFPEVVPSKIPYRDWSWDYLRRHDDGNPAAGTFDAWPATAAEVTVMDPCCGSGHFLIAMFGMLWRMRSEEEGLSPADAQDAVLRENLFGLELDPRCVQIAMFNVALQAWKTSEGWRQLPTPNVACSGVAARGSLNEWLRAAGTSGAQLRTTLTKLQELFASADDYGSLLDLRRITEAGLSDQRDLFSPEWEEVATVLEQQQNDLDPATGVLGNSITSIAHSAALLSRHYDLCATNVPYRSRITLSTRILDFIDSYHPDAGGDLATAFVDRCMRFASTCALVSPQSWLFQPWYKSFRQRLLENTNWRALARLGSGAFGQISGEVVNVALLIADNEPSVGAGGFAYIDLQAVAGVPAKAGSLRCSEVEFQAQAAMLSNPDARIARPSSTEHLLLADRADSSQGICTGDYSRFGRHFWELPAIADGWERQQSTVTSPIMYGGREWILLWEGGNGKLRSYVSERLGEGREGSWLRGLDLLGRRGVVVSQSGDLKPTLYNGELLDNNAAAIVPNDDADLPALWAFCSSDEYRQLVRNIDSALKVTNRTLIKVPFDVDRWRRQADQAGVLPEPWSDDPTQWLFEGRPDASTSPLQVAVARLLGYHWPDQKPDALEQFADSDGIAALKSLPGEPDLATRLRELLAAAYGDQWSSTLERRLVTEAGGRNGRLEDWLRDRFFSQHVKVFDNRPFLWHVWDGRSDGFSAIVNYHRLDHRTLEKLTFASLGAWIERQKHETAASRAGADARLASAEDLQERLKLILEGAPPYDVYVRWKELQEQPVGWNPDLDDGVRLNIRPFVTAGVLRSKVNVHWKKDRGTNPDGSDRINDLHPTLEKRREARQLAGVKL